MQPRKFAPFIWFRLVAILIFVVLVAVQHMWVLVAIGVALAGLSIVQLVSAYRQ